jgi:hypothetical protein
MKSPTKASGAKAKAKLKDLKPTRSPKGGSRFPGIVAPIKVGGNILPPGLSLIPGSIVGGG